MSDLESFRRDARAWLEANCPAEMRQPVVSENDACWGGRHFKFQSEAQRTWMQKMGERGWTVPTWPNVYGGGGGLGSAFALRVASFRTSRIVEIRRVSLVDAGILRAS